LPSGMSIDERSTEEETAATEFLRARKVSFTCFITGYTSERDTSLCTWICEKIGATEKELIKTMVYKYKGETPCLVLMQGHRMVDSKKLASILQVSPRSVKPAPPEYATQFTGYDFGGTSPFGTRVALPIFMDSGIDQDLDIAFINGGRRGLTLRMKVAAIKEFLPVTVAELSKDV